MKTILIVEDSPVQLELLRRALEGAHYRVITATDGAQGLAMAKAHHPDAIVTDLNVSVMDGFAMCQAIRTDAAFDPSPKTERGRGSLYDPQVADICLKLFREQRAALLA